jgi:hypothetical protein
MDLKVKKFRNNIINGLILQLYGRICLQPNSGLLMQRAASNASSLDHSCRQGCEPQL